MRKWTLLAAALSASLTLAMVGCSGGSEDEAEPEKPKVAFEGKPDERIVGAWKVTNGDTVYTFSKDGGFKLKGTVSTQGGVMKNESSGQWAVNGDRLLILDAQKNVIPYSFEIEGKKLTLALTGSLKSKTVMLRQ